MAVDRISLTRMAG